jgi:hypothetical protein
MDVIELLKSYDTYYGFGGINCIEVQKHCKGEIPCKHRINYQIRELSWWAWWKGYEPRSGSGVLYADQVERLFWLASIPVPEHFAGAGAKHKALVTSYKRK